MPNINDKTGIKTANTTDVNKSSTEKIFESTARVSSANIARESDFIYTVERLDVIFRRAQQLMNNLSLHDVESENPKFRATCFNLDQTNDQYQDELTKLDQFRDDGIANFDSIFAERKAQANQILYKPNDLYDMLLAKENPQEASEKRQSAFITEVRELDKLYEQAKLLQRHLRSSEGYAEIDDQKRGISELANLLNAYRQQHSNILRQFKNDDIPNFDLIMTERFRDEQRIDNVLQVHEMMTSARERGVEHLGDESFDPFNPNHDPFESQFDLYDRKKVDDVPLNNERLVGDAITKMSKIKDFCDYCIKQVDKFQIRNQETVSLQELTLSDWVKVPMNSYRANLLEAHQALKDLRSASGDSDEYKTQLNLFNALVARYNDYAQLNNKISGVSQYEVYSPQKENEHTYAEALRSMRFMQLSKMSANEKLSSSEFTSNLDKMAQAIQDGQRILQDTPESTEPSYTRQKRMLNILSSTYNMYAKMYNEAAEKVGSNARRYPVFEVQPRSQQIVTPPSPSSPSSGL